MSEAVLALQEMPIASVEDGRGSSANPTLSAPAAALIRWAGVAYWLGMGAAVLPVVLAMTYVGLAAEPLWQRLMTLVVVGLVPAVGCILAGILLHGALKVASRVIDRVIAALCKLLQPVTQAIGAGARSCGRRAVGAMPSGVRLIVGSAVAVWKGWENLCWMAYVAVRTVVGAVAAAATFLARGAAGSILLTGRAARLIAVALAAGIRGGVFGVVWGFRALVRGLDAIGCAINEAIRLSVMAATFPLRLIARLLLHVSGSSPPHAAALRRQAQR
jgi:hypothetical protein